VEEVYRKDEGRYKFRGGKQNKKKRKIITKGKYVSEHNTKEHKER
jgi:hypothetical protein